MSARVRHLFTVSTLESSSIEGLTFFRKQMVEIVQIVVSSFAILRIGNKVPHQEQDDRNYDESQCVFERFPKSLSQCLASFFGSHLIVCLIPEVGERQHNEAEEGVERVKGVVEDLQSHQNAVDLILRRPIFSRAISGGSRRRHKCDINRK